jgi:hypothetical protein
MVDLAKINSPGVCVQRAAQIVGIAPRTKTILLFYALLGKGSLPRFPPRNLLTDGVRSQIHEGTKKGPNRLIPR